MKKENKKGHLKSKLLLLGLLIANASFAAEDKTIELNCASYEKALTKIQVKLHYELIKAENDGSIHKNDSGVVQFKSSGTMKLKVNKTTENLLVMNTSQELDYFILSKGPYMSGRMPGAELKGVTTLKTWRDSDQALLSYNGNLYAITCSSTEQK